LETFRRAIERRIPVDDQHNGAPIKTLEPEDMALKHLLSVIEAVPGGRAAASSAFALFVRPTVDGCELTRVATR